jgi:hypothetical protein
VSEQHSKLLDSKTYQTVAPESNNGLFGSSKIQLILKLGFTTILLGYLVVWLPQPVVGLSFIGLEMGEWVKFLPQVRSGEIMAAKDLFYVPPITLSFMLLLWTLDWPNRRWKTWGMRIVAVFVSMLTLPAIEVVQNEPLDQWLVRSLAVVLVVGGALAVAPLNPGVETKPRVNATVGMVCLAALGAILPTWVYLSVRPAAQQVIGVDVGFGPGFWLNLGGNLMVVVACLLYLNHLHQINNV